MMGKELAKTYDPKGMEERLYKMWEEKKYFHAEVDRSKKPFTIVMPPPNITGQLHMGHAFDNTMRISSFVLRECRDTTHFGSREQTMPQLLRKLRLLNT